MIALIGADHTPTTTSLPERVREAIPGAVVTDRTAQPETAVNTAAAAVHASALRAQLRDTPANLTPAESLVPAELLTRIGSPDFPRARPAPVA